MSLRATILWWTGLSVCGWTTLGLVWFLLTGTI